MKKCFVFLIGLFSVFLVFGVAGAVPTELITNGDFENSSDHSFGWTTAGSVDFTDDFGLLAGVQGLSGHYARLGLYTTDSDSILSQTFSVSGLDKLTVTFNWAFDYLDNSYTAEDNFISILESDGTSAFTITMLDLKTKGTGFFNPSMGFAYGTFTGVYDISFYTADNADVEFKLHEESDSRCLTGTASVVGIDNISIIGDGGQLPVPAEPVPEPATMVLLGLGLMGLAGVTRKTLRK